MSDYLPYGGEPPAQKHSPTSVAAAESVKKSIGPSHKSILSLLREYGTIGFTDEEMQAALHMGANTQRPRRRELELMGRIKNSGVVRKTRSGRDAVVWVLA